ncbi:MAG: nuclear transport factor 2 family protein [Bacteroidota bacterium]
MKTIVFGAIALLSVTLNAQHMKNPTEVVTQLFVATDQQNWDQVKQTFDSEVALDYSSMTGNPKSQQSPDEITTAWKGILPGFESTHHQLGNFIVKGDGDTAQVFCYGTAAHYLTNEGGNLWTVVGTYEFDLTKNALGQWKIITMTFNFKYQDGNTSLPEKAIDNLK